jgi:molybdate transport system ATP-binding protein
MLKVKIKRKLTGFNLDVDFAIDREILAILGSSGSGKTMTLQCIAGLLKPDEGFIELNGRVLFDSEKKINLSPQERKVGFVFQNYALFPHLTVQENITYGIHDFAAKDVSARVDRLMEIMNIPHLAKRLPRQLSSGQQQRVALARALAPEPELLLLDEPFSALDTVRKEKLELELMGLQQSYLGNMLFVTHDLAQGYKLGSKIAIYDSGRIIQIDNKNSVIESPVNRIVARLTGFKNLLEGTVAEVDEKGVLVKVPELACIIRTANQPQGLKPGQPVTIGIRPEHIRMVSAPGENTCLLPAGGVIEDVTALNCRFHTLAGTADKKHIEAVVSKSSGQPVESGRSYYVYLPAEYIVIITG